MAAATSSETGCGEAAAGEKRGPLGIPEAVFVVSGASAGRAGAEGWFRGAGRGRAPAAGPVPREAAAAAAGGA